ncbi:MAG: nucleoside phosphorylase [Oscillospiraceae bacterium]|nr:nucleoside phosphorylase [Oscillospiraceae bacterium]
MSIIHTYDPERSAVINPETNTLRHERKLDAIIINFSRQIMDALLQDSLLEVVEEEAIRFVSSAVTMYAFKGTNIGVAQTQVGAAYTISVMEASAHRFSCGKFILFGSCGGLDSTQTYGKLIVPTASYRDEGVSYHYVPAADFIDIPNHILVEKVLNRLNIPCAKGKNWTTDAFYRETRRNMELRKAAGCISVDMELSACQAVADFRGYELYAFFYSADNLDHAEWDEGILSSIGLDERLTHFHIALEIAKTVTEANHE